MSSSSSSTPTNPPAYAVPAQTLKHFQSDPWTSSFLSLATHTAIKTSSRTSDPSTGEDAFIAHTIGSPTTIPYCLTLRKNHPDTPPPRLPYARFPLPATGPDAPKLTPIHSRKVDLFTLFTLGTPGLNGHINTAHGCLGAHPGLRRE
ncbi:thioesterase [Histoplasma capsulatum var. duboisii H88]|nr:thioesterase [Histoplasma capsulatum var. duboisii H88]